MAKHLRKECRTCPKKVIDQLNSMYATNTREELNQSSDHGSTDNSFVVEEVDVNSSSIPSTPDDSTENPNRSDQISSTPKSPKFSSNSMSKFYDSMTEKEEKNLNNLLALAIYSSGTPFSITENTYWQKFFNAIRPSFKLPPRRKISNILLDSTYEKVKGQVDEKIISARTVGMQCDSWSNIRNECIMNFIVTTPTPVFFKTLTTSSASKSAINCSRKMMEVIEAIGPQKIMGICTDNEPVMRCTWEILDEQYEEQSISFYGCTAHILNLLVKDIANILSVSECVQNSTSIIKEIKKSHVLSALFVQAQNQNSLNEKCTLKLPIKTRFGYLLHCLESLLKNKNNLELLAVMPDAQKYLSIATRNNILNNEYWIRVTRINELIKPIGQCIFYLEGDDPKISQVTEAFANLLDPNYKGANLTIDQEAEGYDLISKVSKKLDLDYNRVMAEYSDYVHNDGIWSKDHIKQAITDYHQLHLLQNVLLVHMGGYILQKGIA
ncbi:uncharacterized protein LOC124295157 [Neodiprion lecontei]|uniref:Uncharacterized protein LOC124295157 n=1 Tax=Neodiprion lecontei TaxID=441921 RepID=A0ABM3GIB1_NEOLC|nr:uncharacterized protein LOC124295157 [Neodiprion lecontei]